MSDRLGTLLREQVASMSAPAVMPPAHSITGVARRRRRSRAAAPVVLAAAAAVVAAVGVPAALDRPDRLAEFATPGGTAAQPDEQRLRQAFADLPPDMQITLVMPVQPSSLAAGEFGDVPREQSAGVIGETADKTMSVTWVVLTPALTPQEGERRAREAFGPPGTEALTKVRTGAPQRPIRSVVYRVGDGSFVAISAWSQDGGFVSLTNGRGATITDTSLADLEDRTRRLLSNS
jgi:hypothetical protein